MAGVINKEYPQGHPRFLPESLTEIRDALGFTPKRILDYGYGWGISSSLWLEWFPDAEVICCDPIPQGKFEDVDPVAKLCGVNWTFINEPAEVVLKTDIEPFDFIFIDADHKYKSTLEQLRLSWDKLLPGGIMAGHDYTMYGVRTAVIEFAKETGLSYRIFSFDIGCWMFERKGGG